jgi:hypothetical protein
MKKTWRTVLKWLRKEYSTDRPIKIILTDRIPGDWGQTTRTDNSFYIYITREQPLTFKYDTLIHEWAHVHTYDSKNIDSNDDNPHTTDWGIMYAKLTRAWEEKWNTNSNV